MADWKSLLEKNPAKKLAELTAKPKEDKTPELRRNKLLTLLNETASKFAKAEERKGVLKTVGDYVHFTPRVGSKAVAINGDAFALIPKERFAEFLTGFNEHVKGGGFDEDIAKAFTGEGGKPASTSSGARKPMNQEAKDKIAAAQRARHAKAREAKLLPPAAPAPAAIAAPKGKAKA